MTEIIQVDADHITITESTERVDPHGEPDMVRRAVIVMDGEEPENVNSAGEPIDSSEPRNDLPGWDEWDPDTGPFLTVPVQVRRLTAPCQTCGGEYDEAFQWRDWQTVERIQNCPDCHNGTPTFTLHQRCDAEVHKIVARSCPDCIDLGSGWDVTDVLPIVDCDDTPLPAEFNWIEWFDDGEHLVWWGLAADLIALPSAASPGQYAIFAEQETT